MEVNFIEQEISNILKGTYKVVTPDLVIRLKECMEQYGVIQNINAQFELQKNQQDFEARKLSLDASVKTIAITGGDLIENSIKYKKFLLNQ